MMQPSKVVLTVPVINLERLVGDPPTGGAMAPMALLTYQLTLAQEAARAARGSVAAGLRAGDWLRRAHLWVHRSYNPAAHRRTRVAP